MSKAEQIEKIKQEIKALQAELSEIEGSLPRHSVQAAQLIRIEDLEEAINEKQAELKSLID